MAVGGATVRVAGLPVVVTNGARALPAGLRDAVVAAVRRDVVEPREVRVRDGLRRTTAVRCVTCDVDLLLPPRRSEKPVPVLHDGHAFTVFVEADWGRCRDCGTEQVTPNVGMDRVLAALDAVFDVAVGGDVG